MSVHLDLGAVRREAALWLELARGEIRRALDQLSDEPRGRMLRCTGCGVSTFVPAEAVAVNGWIASGADLDREARKQHLLCKGEIVG